MCGICGYIDMKKENRIDQAILEQMVEQLHHRGPDAKDFYIESNIGLGFDRLSIIDLETGMQPIFNEDKTVLVICNGEIYNYRELSESLVLKGHRFKTKCDVEVIVHLYEEYGTEFIKDLNGQFAFAIYDMKKDLLVCARDHVGIAPFFYTVVDSIFIFASEIKAILQHPLVKREVDLVSLDQILSFPGMVSPRTLIKNINSLENGHYIVVKENSIRNFEYWDLIYPEKGQVQEYSEDYYTEKLEEILIKAVKYRLHADVPVGFYISGGLDSSLIAAIIKQVDNTASRHSFSIDFTEKNISESKYQRIVANYVNSIHHETVFQFSDISRLLKDAVYFSESALKETYNTASMTLSKNVRSNDIKVVLTGEGADEIFGGYVGYKFDRLRKQNSGGQTYEDRKIQAHLWGDEDFIYEKNHHQYNSTKRELYSENLNRCFAQFDCTNYPLLNVERIKNLDLLQKRSYLDFKLRLSDHLLSDHGDRMAYANSVEARYPYLDKDFIGFAVQIPSELKLKEYNEKYILKKVAQKYVPQEIIKRPKFAFVAPGSPNLLKEDVNYIKDILSYETIKRQGFFNPDTIESLKIKYMKNGFKLNLPYENDLLIIAITFGIFLDTFKVSDCR